MATKAKIAQTKRQLAARERYLKSGLNKPNRIATRGVHRDKLTGRPRGYMRYFGLSRITFRELALKGELPGVVKASK